MSLRWNWFRESSPGAVPLMGSVYVLTPGAAKIMAKGRIPGVVVTPELLKQVQAEWRDKKKGHSAAVERFSAMMRCFQAYTGISAPDLRNDPLGTFSPKPWRTSPKSCFFRAGSVGIAAFNIWHFSAPNPNALNIPVTAPVGGAGKAVVRCIRIALACGSGLTGAGQPMPRGLETLTFVSSPLVSVRAFSRLEISLILC